MQIRKCLQAAQVNVVEQYAGRFLEFREADEEKSEADDDLTEVLDSLVLLVQHHHEAYRNQRKRNGGNVIGEAEDGHYPGGYGRTDIRSHYDAYRLGQCKETGIDETDDHDRGGSGRLYGGCNADTSHESLESIGSHGCEEGT